MESIMKSRRYPYRIITPLPLIEDGGDLPVSESTNTQGLRNAALNQFTHSINQRININDYPQSGAAEYFPLEAYFLPLPKVMSIGKAKTISKAIQPTERELLATNRIFDGGLGVGKNIEYKLSTNPESIYRVTGESQIDDITASGFIRPPIGKLKGGHKGEVHWSRGNENLYYYDKRPVLEMKASKMENNLQGAKTLDDLDAIWKFNEKMNRYENILQKKEGGGGIPAMTPRNTAQVNIPDMTSAPSEIKQGGGFSVGSAAGIAGVAGGVLNALAMSNQGGYSNPAILPGNSTTQQTVDSVASMLPFYSLGKSIGNYAKTDYMAQNEFGELANENKFKVADTIGTFIDPLGSLVSGLSGEGWTANERAKIINEKAAPARQAFEKRKAAELKQREVDAGLGGKYWDQNQLMQAEMGGELRFMQPIDKNLPVGRIHPFYYQGSSERASSIGGENGEPAYLIPTFKYGRPLQNPREEFNKTGEHLGGPFKTWQEADKWENEIRHPYVEKNQAIPSPLKTWGEMEQGGPIFDQNSTPKGMMVTAYNEGGEHSENKSGYGGVPVDQFGNKVVASNARPVATTEEGEISYFSRKNGSSYVFSNKLFV